jgi:hypothetical protein
MNRILLILSVFIATCIMFYPTNSKSNASGSPGGKTGSIGDNQESCSNCHYAGVGNGASITSNIPTSGYIPGETYTITATVEEAGRSKFGFEVTSEDNTGNKKGSFLATNSTETNTIINSTAITHKAGGTNGTNIKSWEFDWVAPGFASSTGSVIFYGSFLGANGDGQNTGDTYHSDQLEVFESTNTPNNIKENEELNSILITNNKIHVNKNINSLNVYDISGKLILSKNHLKTHNLINLTNFSEGIYIVRCSDKNGKITTTKRFIIK